MIDINILLEQLRSKSQVPALAAIVVDPPVNSCGWGFGCPPCGSTKPYPFG